MLLNTKWYSSKSFRHWSNLGWFWKLNENYTAIALKWVSSGFKLLFQIKSENLIIIKINSAKQTYLFTNKEAILQFFTVFIRDLKIARGNPYYKSISSALFALFYGFLIRCHLKEVGYINLLFMAKKVRII